MIAAAVNILSTVPSTTVIGPIVTIVVMLLTFVRAALRETPQWSKRFETAFFALAIPLSVAFIIIVAARIAPLLPGR